MDEYIESWLTIIENMANDNTYKLAWGRAIVENALLIDDIHEKNVITFDDIARTMIKYYWNQSFFFNLKQSANNKKPPVLVQNTFKLIEQYKSISDSTIPIWFDKAESVLKQDNTYYQNMIHKSAKKLKDDVSWRFKNIQKETYEIYGLDKENLCIYLTGQEVQLIKDYHYVLAELLNYRWAQLLEKYNTAPKIANKVKGISDNQLRRNSLTKYKNLLLEYYGSPIDFYTGDPIEEDEISIDHVIPWSFIYSDDIWNLVMTTKSHNSSKSNSVPQQDIIDRLNQRNQDMVDKLSDAKSREQLLEAINNDYVNKFYLAMRL